jgi:hypothetical protein
MPSRIARIPTASLTPESGYVVLGYDGTDAIVHLAPFYDPVRVFFPRGDLSRPQVLGPDEPDPDAEGMLAVSECPRPSWDGYADTIYDPSPNPFRWEDFAAAHPDLAATLTPHQWAGE